MKVPAVFVPERGIKVNEKAEGWKGGRIERLKG